MKNVFTLPKNLFSFSRDSIIFNFSFPFFPSRSLPNLYEKPTEKKS